MKFIVHLSTNYMWKRANKRIEITAKSMGDVLEIIKVEFSPKWEISMIWPEYIKKNEFTLQDSINEFFKCFPPKKKRFNP